MNKIYCPKCSYEVVEEYLIIGEEVFCQNCLAWSIIDIDSGDNYYLDFSRYETTTNK